MAREGLRERAAAIYKYHKVFDGYNFLSGPKGMEEIVTHDMELVSLEDHEAALQATRRAALLEAAEVVRAYKQHHVDAYAHHKHWHVAQQYDLDKSATAQEVIDLLARLASEGE